ncbi:23S rRNA pseudouridine(955/2504/2580) synthase RluC [Reinekea marinisedimentorum]|uniref:Pseudouridine synthase n=1 Tax=Reinekea marinisedimentorum TaxID=230495 RepID=A0A4R3ID39_9GAMM|nr:23S rRNA pseudouridine(955/2504/2580) synthase RluC [Reinekea marinisedimentorum]TCS42565.1 23S rRNA pseudouridine955/2504/2580 synthase [Reinekea marinisedimentorum]
MSKVRFVDVESDRADQRLDNFLRYHMNNVPKSRIYRIIRKGEVRVNGKRAKADTRLCAGDTVRIPPVSEAQKEINTHQPSQGLRNTLKNAIIFEDDVMIAINKPSGLAVHGGSGLKLGLIEAVRADRPDERFLELVHRLDRDTSGVVLIAKKRSSLTRMQDYFRLKKDVQKTYWCLVSGQWPADKRMVDAPLLRHEESTSGERRVSVHGDGKPSKTKYRLLKQFDRCAWVEAQPITGRTHQIRVHCQYAGHCILGDDKYQDKKAEQISKQIGLGRLFLHAAQLTLPHPVTGEQMTFNAELDASLKALLASLNSKG